MFIQSLKRWCYTKMDEDISLEYLAMQQDNVRKLFDDIKSNYIPVRILGVFKRTMKENDSKTLTKLLDISKNFSRHKLVFDELKTVKTSKSLWKRYNALSAEIAVYMTKFRHKYPKNQQK